MMDFRPCLHQGTFQCSQGQLSAQTTRERSAANDPCKEVHQDRQVNEAAVAETVSIAKIPSLFIFKGLQLSGQTLHI